MESAQSRPWETQFLLHTRNQSFYCTNLYNRRDLRGGWPDRSPQALFGFAVTPHGLVLLRASFHLGSSC